MTSGGTEKDRRGRAAEGAADGRRRWSRAALAGSWLVLAGLVAWTLLRGFGIDRVTPLAQLMSYTPYVGAASVAVLAAVLFFRRWREAVVAALVVGAFAVFVVPRAVPASASVPDGGVRLRVMSINLLGGGAEARAVVDLVRRERPDVLSVQELAPASVADLDALGLARLLPYRALRPAPDVSGTGLYARHPLTGGRGLDERSTFDMARAVLRLPRREVDVVAVHPSPPVPGAPTGRWERDLLLLPAAPDDGPVRVLAGDFNATLDHALLRRLLDTGYRDAAASTGAGLAPTWPQGRHLLPPVTIDHVLVDDRAGVRAFRTHPVPGSDHAAVVADLVLT